MVKWQQIKTEAKGYTRMSDIDGTEALYISESKLLMPESQSFFILFWKPLKVSD